MMHRCAWAAVMCAALAAMAAQPVAAQAPAHEQAQARYRFDTTPGHLSKQVVPSHYQLWLDLDPARDDFSGKVEITLKVREPVAAIELHAQELAAAGAHIVSQDGSDRVLGVAPLPATQSWRLTPADGAVISAGEYRLEIAYTGKVHGYDDGLFRAPYQVRGEARQMLATQLEASFARMLFPGFDEPSFRASFELTVRAPAAFDVVSNMPRVGRAVEGGHALHRFAASPPMPSYLLSVAVGRFETLAGRAAGVPLRLLTAEGKREQAQFALRATQDVLPYYTRYFGVPFALPKLDQLAVPSVRSGAMEDWGLISYSEDTMLVDPAHSSGDTVREVYKTIAHEIAHQWFGNLVTAASWEEIWLNEAFATWMETKATDHFNPAWAATLAQREAVEHAMAIDAGAGTRAIRSGPVSDTAVSSVFDPITYAKGAAVLAMLEQWIGPDAFRRGLVAYMKGQRLSNATAADLWHYIGEASGRDVAAVAASWTDQPGFPLVSVKQRCDAGRTVLDLEQVRFTSPGAPVGQQVWRIPLRVAQGRSLSVVMFDSARASVALGACDSTPLIVNAGGAGFYRVAYAAESVQALTRRFGTLDAADRLALLDDDFALMQAGRASLASYFAMLSSLPQVRDASAGVLWAAAGRQLEFLDDAMAGTPAQQPLRSGARALLAPRLARLGWAPQRGEAPADTALRPLLISLLARFDDAGTTARALRLFDDDDAGRAALPVSIRAAVVHVAGMHADRVRFDRLVARLKSAGTEEERWMLADALGAGRDADRAGELLALSLAGVAPANIASAIPGIVARSSPFGELAYRYTVAHWQSLAALAGSWNQARLLPNAAAGFNDAGLAQRLIDDQQREAGPDGEAPAMREAEAIRLRAAVKSREAAGLDKLLALWRPGMTVR